MSDPHPIITVAYCDHGIVLQTAAGAVAVLPPGDALALSAALTQAVQDHAAHQQLIADINDIHTGE